MTLSVGNGHFFCDEPVSWLSTNVTAFSGNRPIIPGALPSLSRILHSSPCTADCRMPLVVKSNAMAGPPTALAQFTSSSRSASWLTAGFPSPS
ncbi:hypothetical protein CFC21_066124 [Triticum aestivum]|uniref:Uncharacterized protein n=3 Tax=Triticum TaxID=4564 RepID=A0A9R0TQS9_TRITD|nr:hypothetical protein CFC21_066124 [Triticum aestivum]VAI18339.1 unnamed protein product [Triticum turgidum subsp. durum]